MTERRGAGKPVQPPLDVWCERQPTVDQFRQRWPGNGTLLLERRPPIVQQPTEFRLTRSEISD
jgi:hypothetical protein